MMVQQSDGSSQLARAREREREGATFVVLTYDEKGLPV